MDKKNAISIKLLRAEGPIALCGKSVTVTGEKIWNQADRILATWAHTAPKQGYDKCDFWIVYEGDEEDVYQGRYDLMDLDREYPSIKDHILDHMNWYAGLAKNPWCGEVRYRAFLEEYASNGIQKEYQNYLETHQIGD